MHAHRNEAEVDYDLFFSELSRAAPDDRVWATEERLVAIPNLELTGGKVYLVAYEGAPDERPVILNVASGQERDADVAVGEIVATKTHAVVDLRSREAIIEYNHRGAKAQDIAAVLGRAGRGILDLSGFWLEFNPKVEEGFVEAIEEFERIRVASMKLARPNSDWEEWRSTLSDVADESGAQHVAAEMSAGRGQSLEQNRGFVGFIKERVLDPVSGLKSAAVVGTRWNESSETKVTTTDHKTHQRVSVRLNEAGQVDETDMRRRLWGVCCRDR
jgi:hypothetical protein